MSKLEHTPVSEIGPAYDKVRKTFLSGATRPVAWRKHQLNQLGFLIQDNEDAFVKALEIDLSRPAFETITSEINPVKAEINEAYSHLEKWAKPNKVKTTMTWALAKATIYSEPKGVALIIGTWNYPITLVLGPFVGAIAAGCTAILKPAEQNPNIAMLLARLLPQYMDPTAYHLVNGAVDETTELLKHRYDHIFYTGSGNIGRIIAKAAAEHLTPVTLELGGKSPACVFDDAKMEVVGRRIAWGKYSNSGQICIAPDYILTTPTAKPKLIAALKEALKSFTAGTSTAMHAADSQFCKIVSPSHYERLTKLLDGTNGKVVIGGGRNPEANKLEVTVVDGVTGNDILMQSEIFGPILPIITVHTKEEMVSFIQERDNPLALYAFTQSQANRDYIFEHTRSGGFVQNDVVVHFIIPGLPFGGAGQSGYGNYHGKKSFDTFSHERASASIPTYLEPALKSRYPPYTPEKLKMMLLLTRAVIKRPASGWARLTALFKYVAIAAVLVGGWKYRASKL